MKQIPEYTEVTEQFWREVLGRGGVECSECRKVISQKGRFFCIHWKGKMNSPMWGAKGAIRLCKKCAEGVAS